jgi:hypothetical protein
LEKVLRKRTPDYAKYSCQGENKKERKGSQGRQKSQPYAGCRIRLNGFTKNKAGYFSAAGYPKMYTIGMLRSL